tara:strand:+ start:314 stop:490 length:177 start_codon:yes stop_codon:yes gene_type:complete
MKNLTRKKTLLEKEFKLLVQELKDSGLKVNKNFEEENNRNILKVTIIKKREHNRCPLL